MILEDLKISDLSKFYLLFTTIVKDLDAFPVTLRTFLIEREYTELRFEQWLHSYPNFRKIIIAKDNNTIVGFIIGDHTYGGVGFVSWLGVKSEYRRQGIARNLVDKYIEFCQLKHAHRLELWTYLAMQGFYEKLQFETVGIRKNGYFGQENIIMGKEIGSWKEEYLQLPK